jgi:GNAT superfamily N-acetyltransferase
MTQVFSERTIDEYLIGWTRTHHLPNTTYSLAGPLFHVQFAQPLKGTTTDFFFMHASTPDQVTQAIERSQHNRSHWLTIFCTEEHAQDLVPVYARLGYQFRSQEPLMAKPLWSEKAAHHLATESYAIEATCIKESVSWAQALSQGISVSLAPLLDVVVWHYMLKHDEHHVTKGAWIMTPEQVAYIDEVETEATYRRRGFAQALMSQMLGDAAAAGATESILSATPMGKPLYKKLGYTEPSHNSLQSSRTVVPGVLQPAQGTRDINFVEGLLQSPQRMGRQPAISEQRDVGQIGMGDYDLVWVTMIRQTPGAVIRS